MRRRFVLRRYIKNEMERYVISDIDIEHLHNTVELVLDIIKKDESRYRCSNVSAIKGG